MYLISNIRLINNIPGMGPDYWLDVHSWSLNDVDTDKNRNGLYYNMGYLIG